MSSRYNMYQVNNQINRGIQESVKARLVHQMEIPKHSSLTRVSPAYQRGGYLMQIEAGVKTQDSEVWVKFYVEGSIPLVSPEVVFIFEGVHHVYDVQVQPQVPAAANSGRLVYQYKTSLQRMPYITNYSTILVHVHVKLYA